MRNDIVIRPLTFDDLPQIATIHVRAWQQAYKNQMPQDYLDGLDAAKRLEKWREIFTQNKDDTRYGTLVATVAGTMAGFLSYGPARDEARDGWKEIYAINILQEYWSKGVGYSLFSTAKKYFNEAGFRQTYLWVLATNQNALQAYRRWDGVIEEDCTKNTLIGDAPLKEISVSFISPQP